MHPTIFRLGSFELRAYGLMLAISFLIGITLAIYRAKKQKIDPNPITDLSVLIIIAAILGSRFLYVIYHLDEFRGRWLDTINPFQSNGQIGLAGLTMLGGVVASIIVSFWYLWRKKLPALKIADIMIPSVAMGIFLTRIGCFFNGCCFGKPGHVPWGVKFPESSMAGFIYPDQALHPTQLYSSLYGLLMFALLLLIERRKKFDGELFSWFLVFYGVSRFTVDFYRYYEASMVALRLGDLAFSVNQIISALFILGGGFLLIFGYNKRKFRQINEKTA